MKEVLTKKFWQDVKKIFDEARADTPSEPKPESVTSNVSEEAPVSREAPSSNS